MGRWYGRMLQSFLAACGYSGKISLQGYAVIGAASMLSGTTRMTLSISVLVMESTVRTDKDLVLLTRIARESIFCRKRGLEVLLMRIQVLSDLRPALRRANGHAIPHLISPIMHLHKVHYSMILPIMTLHLPPRSPLTHFLHIQGALSMIVPIMTAVFFAKLIGDHICLSVHDTQIRIRGAPVLMEPALRHHQKMVSLKLTAADVMANKVGGIHISVL